MTTTERRGRLRAVNDIEITAWRGTLRLGDKLYHNDLRRIDRLLAALAEAQAALREYYQQHQASLSCGCRRCATTARLLGEAS